MYGSPLTGNSPGIICPLPSATGRDADRVAVMRAYLSAAGLLRDYAAAEQDPAFSQVVELDLATVVPSVSGPKRPHDRVAASQLREDFLRCLPAEVSEGQSGGQRRG